LSDLVASWLRTVVPGLYSAAIGSLLAWLAAHSPWVLDLLEALGIDPTSDAFTAGVVFLVLAGWYAGWRRLEPYIPDWLTRVVLGSSKAPTYVGTYPESLYATNDRVVLTNGALVTIGATIMEPGVKVPSYTATYASGQQVEVRETDIVGKA